jgi:hypothetical protein
MKIEIQITQEQIQEAVAKCVNEALERGYSNPVKDAVDAELKNVDGSIKVMVKELISNAINDDKFKEQMQKTVIEKLVLKAMGSN